MAGSSSVELLAGSVVNTTPDVAEKWQKQGIAMEDKSMDGGENTTDVVVNLPEVMKSLDRTGEEPIERKTRNVRRRRIKK